MAGRYLWVLLGMAVTCAWLFVSAQVFRLFGEDQWTTVVLAAGVGVTVPTLANTLGVYHKRGGHRFLVLAMSVGLVALFLVIVALRSFYSDALETGSLPTNVREPTWVVSWLVTCAAAGLTVLFVIASYRKAAPVTSGEVQ